MAPNCSHWWHAPIYVVISIALALVAISPSSDSNSNHTPTPNQPSLSTSPLPTHISTNASRALRSSGFTFMATLLQISPELLLPASQSTVFAIHDAAISNISLPPWLMKDLLHYHTSPLKLDFSDLLKQPQGGCLPTLLNGKNLSFTKVGREEGVVEINGVLITHPDIFTQGGYSIQGVGATFSSVDPLEQEQDWDFNGWPSCGGNASLIRYTSTASRNKIPWNRIIRLLSSNGYVSFSIGLNSVLGRIVEECVGVNSVTIFAPREFGHVASPLVTLEMMVRAHIMPGRFGYKQLLSLPVKTALRTLDDGGGNVVEIIEDYNGGKQVSINGVEITAPDVLSSNEFVAHGISESL